MSSHGIWCLVDGVTSHSTPHGSTLLDRVGIAWGGDRNRTDESRYLVLWGRLEISTCWSANHMFSRSTTASINCFVSGPEFSLLAVAFDAPKPSSRRFRRLPSGWDSSFSALLLRLRCSSKFESPVRYFKFGPSFRSKGTTMPSADFCNFFPAPLSVSSSSQSCRPPRVMRTHFHAYARRIYAQAFRTGIGL
jgi:hypothetical protein